MDASIIDILAGLGRRLEEFATDGIVTKAVTANPWFTAADIRRAAATLASDMLSRDALTKWLAIYHPSSPLPTGISPTSPKNILIIMAGNIPFVGMQDLICVLASGHRALVKPSSKDTVMMSWVVSQLLDIAPGLPVELFKDNSPPPDAVIAMGGDEAVAAIGEKYSGIPMLLRGNRSSLAVLDGGESPDTLAGLADDVLSYSGLGCRNVSLVFVPRGYDFTKLQTALSQYETSPKHRNNYRQARALLRMNGTPHIDAGSCLLAENKDFPANVSILNYAFYDTLHEVKDWIEAHALEIQCVATDINNYQLSIINYQLGRTQRPTLTDYPDGCDTMKFLLSLHKP